MARELRPQFEWSQVVSCYDDPVFDDTAVKALFLAVGPPPGGYEKVHAVASALRELTANFAFDLWGESQPSASVEEVEAQRVAEACRRLLQIVGIDGEDEPTLEAVHPFFGRGGLFASAALRGEASGQAAVMNALRSVHFLRIDAERMASIRQKRPRRGRGRPPAVALSKLVAGLSELYLDVWRREPGISRGLSGEAGGAFVRLMLAVTDAVKARLGHHSLAVTPESLTAIWRGLEPEDGHRWSKKLAEAERGGA